MGILLAASLAACSPYATPTAALLPGDTIPAEWHTSSRAPEQLAVLWIFKTEDCLSCMRAEYPLRRVQAAHKSRVPLLAVHVGREADEGVARSFMRNARLNGNVVTISQADFSRGFAEAAVPAVLVIRGRKILWSSAAPATDTAPGPVKLDEVVGGFLDSPTE